MLYQLRRLIQVVAANHVASRAATTLPSLDDPTVSAIPAIASANILVAPSARRVRRAFALPTAEAGAVPFRDATRELATSTFVRPTVGENGARRRIVPNQQWGEAIYALVMVEAGVVMWMVVTRVRSHPPNFVSSMGVERNVRMPVVTRCRGDEPCFVQRMEEESDASWRGAIEWRLENCNSVGHMGEDRNPRRRRCSTLCRDKFEQNDVYSRSQAPTTWTGSSASSPGTSRRELCRREERRRRLQQGSYLAVVVIRAIPMVASDSEYIVATPNEDTTNGKMKRLKRNHTSWPMKLLHPSPWSSMPIFRLE